MAFKLHDTASPLPIPVLLFSGDLVAAHSAEVPMGASTWQSCEWESLTHCLVVAKGTSGVHISVGLLMSKMDVRVGCPWGLILLSRMHHSTCQNNAR